MPNEGEYEMKGNIAEPILDNHEWSNYYTNDGRQVKTVEKLQELGLVDNNLWSEPIGLF